MYLHYFWSWWKGGIVSSELLRSSSLLGPLFTFPSRTTSSCSLWPRLALCLGKDWAWKSFWCFGWGQQGQKKRHGLVGWVVDAHWLGPESFHNGQPSNFEAPVFLSFSNVPQGVRDTELNKTSATLGDQVFLSPKGSHLICNLDKIKLREF